MASLQELAQLFETMQGRFDSQRAEGVNATVQFDLTGAEVQPFWVKIADGQFQYGQGQTENPRMTLITDADNFVSMMHGDVDPMKLFMMGKIKVKGDTSVAMKLLPLIKS